MKGASKLLTKFSKRLSSDSHVLQVIERSDAETVSFDLFDTLIYRTLARPEDLFLLQGQALVDACLFSGSAEEWQRLRKQAEAEVRLAVSPREVDLAQIYEKLVSDGALNGVESGAMAMAKELELEAEVIRPHREVPSLIDSIRKSGRQVVISTDTYLPEDFIRSTLLNVGIEVDAIVCSSTTGKTKRSGETFSAMRRDFPRTVHFGDNHHADVRNARSAGVAAHWLVWQFYDYRSLYAREIEYLQNIGQYRLPASLMRIGETPLEELATRWAVVLYDYLRDLRRYAVEQDVTDIWLLSRDGESLAAVLQEHADFFGAIPVRYVRASRIFTHSITARLAPDRYKRWTGEGPDKDQIELGAVAARYYASLLRPNSSRVLVVDMTGKGRLQISIGDALSSKISLAGYYFALDFDHEAVVNAGQFLPSSYSYLYQSPVEMLAGTTEGTCVGAVDNDGEIEPVLESDPVDVAPEAYVDGLRRVLNELCALDHAALPVDSVGLWEHRKKHIRQLLMHPNYRVANAMAEWPFIDSYGAQPTYLGRPLVPYSSRLLARKSAVNAWPSLGIYSALPTWGVPFAQNASQARLIMKDWLANHRQQTRSEL